MPPRDLPTWRSLLYVPAHQRKLVKGAHTRGADAIILDLEDSVPESVKESARAALAQAVPQVALGGGEVIVRINKPWRLAWRDLEAAVSARVAAILLPKVDGTAQVQVIAEYLSELERQKDLAPLRLLAIIESARGLLNVKDIAQASPRLCALIPGNEDLATELEINPDPAHMLHTHLPILLAARTAGILAIGTIGSSADFRELETYRERIIFSRDWGFQGTTCIHPDQVGIVNEVYRPSPSRVAEARKVVAAFEAADREAINLEGKMVDRPIYLRAKRLLARADVT